MNSIKSLNILSAAAVAAAAMFAGTQSIEARQLTPMQALENASIATPRMAMSSATGKQSGSYELAYAAESDGLSTLYVFNRPQGGYYVVAADDAVETPLLGYSDKGEFNAAEASENIMGLLESYSEQVATVATASQAEEELSAQAYGGARRAAIAPLMVTAWGQAHNFARFTPEVDGKHCFTGCVATALGQIIYYHRYVKGTGTISYTGSRLGTTLEYDFNGLSIDFGVIERANHTLTNDAACNEISKLLAACGYASKMNYSTTGSATGISAAAAALTDHLGYSRKVRNLSRSYFDEQEWDEIVYSELAAGRPVFYSGSSSKYGGHAWVCDGYDGNGYYHMNWGKEGGLDGYFLLSCPNYATDSDGFSNSQAILVGIAPEEGGSVTAPVMTFTGGMSILNSQNPRTEGTTVNVRSSTGAIYNMSNGEVTIQFGLRLQGTDGSIIYLAEDKVRTVKNSASAVSYNIAATDFPTNGLYRATPVACDANGNWYDCLIKPEKEQAFYLECTPAGIEATDETSYVALHGTPVFQSDEKSRNAVSGIDEVTTETGATVEAQEIYTLAGQLVGNFAGTDTPALASGLYIIRQQMSDGSLRTIKTRI